MSVLYTIQSDSRRLRLGVTSFFLWRDNQNLAQVSSFWSGNLYLDMWQDSFGQVITPLQRPLPAQDNITQKHASSVIQTHDLSNHAGRLKP
jgi:hypothetical protein